MGDRPASVPYQQGPSPCSSGRPMRGYGSRPRHYAALDLGTNNCRLLIARVQGDGFTVIDAFSRIVRLGEGLASTGRISEAAIDRTIAALARSEEHTSELQSLMRISYPVFCLKQKIIQLRQ